MITTERLRQRLRYEPETGALIWLERPVADCVSEHQARAWNARYAGTRAGSLDGKEGYRLITIDGHKYRAARIIWQLVRGEPSPHLIDHQNTDPADNRWANLRLATPKQSSGNTKAHGRSGLKGVFTLKNGRHRASLNGRYLGTFDTPEEAHATYLTAAREAYGEFARGS